MLNIHWKDWCWSWNSNTLTTWCEELTPWKRLWCWERLKAGGEGDEREWDGWMASLPWWTWVWASSESSWWTGKPGMLQSMGSQRVGPDLAIELNWRKTLGMGWQVGGGALGLTWEHRWKAKKGFKKDSLPRPWPWPRAHGGREDTAQVRLLPSGKMTKVWPRDEQPWWRSLQSQWQVFV